MDDDWFEPEVEFDEKQQQSYEQELKNLRVLKWLNKKTSDPKKNQCHHSGRRPREQEKYKE